MFELVCAGKYNEWKDKDKALKDFVKAIERCGGSSFWEAVSNELSYQNKKWNKKMDDYEPTIEAQPIPDSTNPFRIDQACKEIV